MRTPRNRIACLFGLVCLVGCGTKPESEPQPGPAPAAEPAPSPDPTPEPGVPQPSAAEPAREDAKPSEEPAKRGEASSDKKLAAAPERKSNDAPEKKSAADKPAVLAPAAEAKPASDAKPPASAAEPAKPAAAAATVTGPCGEKGQPRCPLQAWMEDHLQAAVDKGDTAAIAKSLSRVPSFLPDPSWNAGDQGWSTLANTGVDAAKKGDIATAKASCKSCHKAWRSKYKQQFRLRVIDPD